MSEQANKDLVIHLYEELDRGNFGVFDEVCTADFRSHFAGRPEAQNRETRKASSREFYEAIPDLAHEILDILAQGDRVAFRGRATGTHQHTFRDYPPTGNAVDFAITRFYRMVDGQIAEEWVGYDSLRLMQQLSAISTPDSRD